jgi:hypothetical protein
MLAAIAWGDLFEVVWVSFAAGTGITAIFSLVIYAGGRSADARRAGNGGAATLYAGVALLAFALFLVGLVIGVTIMLKKG